MTNDDIIKAHKHSTDHRDEIHASELCGCFHCLNIFPPEKIYDWIDEGECAMCPECGIDSVIGSASGYPITRDFMESMCDHWFAARHYRGDI